jgi:hypothetical protein
MVIWPPAPFPQRMLEDGFQFSKADPRISTPMDSKHFKTRRQFSSVPYMVACKLSIHARLRARFDRFWDQDTVYGTQPFMIPDQVYDQNLLVSTEDGRVLSTSTGGGVTGVYYWIVQFATDSAPTLSPDAGPYWKVEFKLLVMPR